MIQSLESELSVLVLSCDKYSHLLPHFSVLFDKYWGLGNRCSKYIATETVALEHDDYKPILTQETNWTLSTKIALSKIETPYVFLVLDDFYLFRPFPAEEIINGLKIAKEANLDKFIFHYPHVAFNGKLEPTKYGSDIGKVRQHSEYTMTLQFSIWNVEFFKKCLFGEESPWEFEINGTERVNNSIQHSIYMKTIPYGYHVEAMTRGKFTDQYYQVLQKESLL